MYICNGVCNCSYILSCVRIYTFSQRECISQIHQHFIGRMRPIIIIGRFISKLYIYVYLLILHFYLFFFYFSGEWSEHRTHVYLIGQHNSNFLFKGFILHTYICYAIYQFVFPFLFSQEYTKTQFVSKHP